MSSAALKLTFDGLDDSFRLEESGMRAQINPLFVEWMRSGYGDINVNLYFDDEVDDPGLFSENISFEYMKSPHRMSPAYASWRGVAFAYPHENYQLQIISSIFKMLSYERQALILVHAPIGSPEFIYAMKYARELVFLTTSPFAPTGNEEDDELMGHDNFLMLLGYTSNVLFNKRNAWCSLSVHDWEQHRSAMEGTIVRK